MPISVFHSLTATTPDATSAEIRPSHWNSQHVASLSLVGSEVVGAFSNANGVSFGLSGTAVTASHNGLTTAAAVDHTHGAPTLALTNLSGTTASNSAGLTLSLSAAAGGGGADGYNVIAAGGSTANTATTVVFSNSNGVSFGLNGGTVTASHNGLTTAAASNHSHGNPSLNLTNLSGTTASNSAGFTLSISAGNYLTTAAASNHSHGNPTLNLTNLSGTTASNSAGFTLSLSAAAPGGAASQTVYAAGNTTVNSSGTMPLSSLQMRGYGILSLGTSNGSMLFSTPDPVTITEMSVGISGGNTAGDTGVVAGGRVVLAGGANITLSGSTNGSSMTISVVGGAGGGGGGVGLGMSNLGNTAGTSGTITTGNVVLVGSGPISLSQSSSGSNGTISILAPAVSSIVGAGNVSISTAGSTITISGGTASPSPIIFSAGTTSGSISSVVFSNSNGMSFGLDGSTITGSYTVPTVPTAYVSSVNGSSGAISLNVGSSLSSSTNGSSITFGLASNITTALQSAGAYLTTAALSNHSHGNPSLNLTNLSGTTASNSAGFTLSLSAGNYLTTAAASNHSHGNPTLNLTNLSGTTASNSAGLTLSLSAGAIPTVTQYFSNTGTTFNGANVSGSMTLNTNGLQLSLSAGAGGGGVTPVASASNGSFSFTTLAFSNANNVTFGTSAGSIITASVAAPGAAAEANAIALLGANTSGNTTATGSTIGWSGIGVTLSGTNGSQVVISAPPTSSLMATGGLSISTAGSTVSIGFAPGTATLWQPFNEGVNVIGQAGNASIHIVPLPTPVPAALGELHVDRLCLPLYFSNSSNSTGTITLSHSFGLYTRSVSSLSLAYSTSYSTAFTFSGTSSASLHHGLRIHTIPWTTTLGDGRYYVAQWSRTSSGGANGSFSQALVSQLNSNFSGVFGAASNRSNQWPMGYGVFSASVTTAMPASIAFSQIDGTASAAARPPSFFMINGTA